MLLQKLFYSDKNQNLKMESMKQDLLRNQDLKGVAYNKVVS